MIRKEPVGFLDPDLIAWIPEAGIHGLFTKTLASCSGTGSYTRMLKFLPGTDTSTAGVQTHAHLEELLILKGAIYDLTLNRNFVAGMYANRLYHMEHGPWRANDGAVTLEVRDFDPDGRITKHQTELMDPDLVEWNESDPQAGVYVKTLSKCLVTGSYGRFVKLYPGATKPRELTGNVGRSEVWVVSGHLQDIRDGAFYPKGAYGNVDIDLLDGNWSSSGGCVVFEVRNLI